METISCGGAQPSAMPCRYLEIVFYLVKGIGLIILIKHLLFLSAAAAE